MILASQSPRRIELLREAGFDPRVRPADIDETPQKHEHPQDLVLRLASAKARFAWKNAPDLERDEVILAADTIVWMGSRVLGKPKDDEEAKAMLKRLSGHVHHVSTGVSIMVATIGHFDGARDVMVPHVAFVETTDVEFYKLGRDEIDAYVASGEPADKAGAYGIQGRGRMLVKGIVGDYFNVVGLPVARVVREIEKVTSVDAREGLVARCLRRAMTDD